VHRVDKAGGRITEEGEPDTTTTVRAYGQKYIRTTRSGVAAGCQGDFINTGLNSTAGPKPQAISEKNWQTEQNLLKEERVCFNAFEAKFLVKKN